MASLPSAQVVRLEGDQITVQMTPDPKERNTVRLYILRNGTAEHRFTLSEMQAILQALTMELSAARSHTLNLQKGPTA